MELTQGGSKEPQGPYPLGHRVETSKIENAVREILVAIGEDPEREGLKGTPRRVAEAYAFLFAGLADDPARHLDVGFQEEHREMVLVRDIPLHSLCEHHLLPMVGKAHVGYIPDGKVVGLSKLARLVEGYARRPQLQERLTAQVADAIHERLGARGAIFVVEAEHLCYDSATEVLTSEGWLPFPDLRDQHRVAQFDPSLSEISFVLPLGVQHLEFRGLLKTYDNRTLSLAVTPEHRHVWRSEWADHKEQPWGVGRFEDLPDGRFYIPRAGVLRGKDLVSPFRGMSPEDYAAFMGAYISEGCTDARRPMVRISQRDYSKGAEEFRGLLTRLGFRRNGHNWQREDGELAFVLRPLGGSSQRYIPEEIVYSSAPIREKFLHFYHLGDGFHNKERNSFGYTTTSEKLADDVQIMSVLTGRATNVRPRKDPLAPSRRKAYDVRSYRDGDGFQTSAALFKDQFVDVPYSGQVHCCSVPFGALVVRRGGSAYVSGNCMTMRGVQKPGSVTVTSAVRGIYARDPRTRQEAMSLITGHH